MKVNVQIILIDCDWDETKNEKKNVDFDFDSLFGVNNESTHLQLAFDA